MSAKKKKNKSFQDSSSSEWDDEFENSFSPVKSPSSPYPRQGNLQGSARKIKDAAADWHNGILKWNALNSEGMKIINKIANIKLEKIFARENEDTEMTSSDLMSPDLEPLCEVLTTVVQSMEKIVKKMESLTLMLSGVKNLEESKSRDGKDMETNPLFQAWSFREFEETFQGLCDMYTKELEVKQTLAGNVAHAVERSTLMMYTACWLHQPYIEDRAELLLESLLLETGHK